MTAGQDGQTWDGKSLAELARENERLRGLLGGPEAWALEADVLERQQRQWADAEARRRNAAGDRPPLKLLTMGDVRSVPKPVDMVEGLVPAPVTGTSCIGTFFGASGAYKSFLAVHLGLCVDNGYPFLGQPVLLTGSSVLVLGEGQAGAGIRADAALDAYPAFAAGPGRVHYVLGAFPLADAAAAGELIGLCQGLPDLRFIWLDSLADFYGDEDESSATAMQKVLAQMRRISAELGCTVIASGHTGHGARGEDGDELPMDRQRGSSRFRQAWDFEIQATGTALVVRKEREAGKLPPVPYRMEKRLDSLAVAASAEAAAAAAGPEPWPHPCPFEAWAKVADAISATPGMSMNTIQRVSRVKREHVSLALLKGEEAGFFANTGTRGSPKWAWAGGGLAGWCEAETAGSAT